jgi:cell division septum initiation protein DivIVA
MWQRAAAALVRDVDDPGDGSAVTARPNYAGDLDDLLDLRPVFRTRSFGYDRLQVDNYATWAESELITARRQIDQLLSRFGECSAELEISRRMLAEAPRGRVYPVSERVEEMMQLAADEATAITQSGAEEAEQLLAEARLEADARLRKAHEIKELALAAADELRERARGEVDEMLRAAAEERDRLDAEAAEQRQRADRAATAQLLTVQQQVDGLCRQRDEARQALARLTDEIGRALEAVVGTLPDDTPLLGETPDPKEDSAPVVVMVDNVVVDERTADEPAADNDRVGKSGHLNGRAQPVSS